jgi:hypothetical protein
MARHDAIDWTPELIASIMRTIANGSTLRECAAFHKMSASIIIWQVRSNEEFAKQYARAIDMRTEADFEALEDELNAVPQSTKFGVDSGWVAWKRVQIDARKWLLSKRNPKKYGERQEIEHSGEVGVKRVVSDI